MGTIDTPRDGNHANLRFTPGETPHHKIQPATIRCCSIKKGVWLIAKPIKNITPMLIALLGVSENLKKSSRTTLMKRQFSPNFYMILQASER